MEELRRKGLDLGVCSLVVGGIEQGGARSLSQRRKRRGCRSTTGGGDKGGGAGLPPVHQCRTRGGCRRYREEEGGTGAEKKQR
jgi:hypothetical protein